MPPLAVARRVAIVVKEAAAMGMAVSAFEDTISCFAKR
jgi:hypothetical protein